MYKVNAIKMLLSHNRQQKRAKKNSMLAKPPNVFEMTDVILTNRPLLPLPRYKIFTSCRTMSASTSLIGEFFGVKRKWGEIAFGTHSKNGFGFCFASQTRNSSRNFDWQMRRWFVSCLRYFVCTEREWGFCFSNLSPLRLMN